MKASSNAMCTAALMLNLLVASASASPTWQSKLTKLGLGSLASAEQYVVGFSPYPGYEGTLDVSGTVKLVGTGLLDTATQTLSWDLQGVDPNCAQPPLDVKNSCGVHIHQGLSCDADAGGHYWNSTLITEDPWLVIRYTAKRMRFRRSKYFARARGTAVNTGFTNYDVLGRTMVVHDATGARVACGLIVPKKLSVNGFVPYVGYTGDLKVDGKVDAGGEEVDDAFAQDLSWYLQGVDPECSQAPQPDVSNACGIHIHAGMSCYANADGHYWNETEFPEDPWKSVVYKSWSNPWGVFAWQHSEAVITGLQNSAANGHTMIVHDATGARVACGILAPQTEIVNAFVPYFSYSGSLRVSGTVVAQGGRVLDKANQNLAWVLFGVDPACKNGPGEAGNSCGVHIHAGMDCTSDALGHYWNTTSISDDPWKTISYNAFDSLVFGTMAFNYNVEVVTGLSNFNTLGHTLIVHDYTGARIACGILNIAA